MPDTQDDNRNRLQHSLRNAAEQLDNIEDDSNFEHMIGKMLSGKYQILSPLGQGGMGFVFKAKDLVLNRFVAIKVLRSAGIDNKTIARRFQQEARAIACLDHPSLIRVHEFGLSEEGDPFLVMDFVDGQTLAQQIKAEAQLPVAEAVQIFIDVCEGLEHAHKMSVLHRDLKPGNIMLVQSASGTQSVRILDFGIAKISSEDGSVELTRTGEVFGSPLYMSPEQAMGRKVDQRSDLYSLGCALYEALTGTPPHVAATPLATIMKHQNDEPLKLSEASLGKKFPDRLEEIVSKVLAKNPDQRYASAEALGDDLKDFLHRFRSGTLTASKAAKAAPKSRKGMVAALMAGTLAAGAAVCLFLTKNTENQPATKTITAAPPPASAQADATTAAIAALNVPKTPVVVPVELKADGSFQLDDLNTALRDEDAFAAVIKHNIDRPELKVPARELTSRSFQSLAQMHSLHILGLNGSTFKEDIPTFQYLKDLPLEELSLSSSTCGDKSLEQVSKIKTLQMLHADTTQVTDAGMRHLAALPLLRFVDLSKTHVGDKGLEYLSRVKSLRVIMLNKSMAVNGSGLVYLPNLPDLEFLELKGTGLKRGCLAPLRNCKLLRRLILDGSSVTDSDLEDIANISSMRKISLQDTGITDQGLIVLAKLKKLKNLDLERCPLITHAGVLKFNQLLPHCKVKERKKKEDKNEQDDDDADSLDDGRPARPARKDPVERMLIN